MSRILVIDDEETTLVFLKKFFTDCGYTVDTELNPTRALERIQDEPYDMVICDIVMPEMDGLDLLDKIKAHDGLIPVIMITSYVSMSRILRAFGSGACNVFTKPLDHLAEIVEEIELAMKRRERIKAVIRALHNQYKEDSLAVSH